MFVVVVGTLILAGAVNTAIVGSNGVLNRVSEDGVLSDWFRQPHPRFGTSYRIINMVVAFQIVTIVASRGDVTFLGNLYAFGVIWSFAMKGIAVLVLRYTHPQEREYRVPLNSIFGKEIPLGLALITLVLLVIAIVNLFTKPRRPSPASFSPCCSSPCSKFPRNACARTPRAPRTSSSINSIWRRKRI